jgi:hypothetical protein
VKGRRIGWRRIGQLAHGSSRAGGKDRQFLTRYARAPDLPGAGAIRGTAGISRARRLFYRVLIITLGVRDVCG